MGFELKSPGNFDKTREFLHRLIGGSLYSDLERYGEMGVQALSAATPKDTGRTAHAWSYRVIDEIGRKGVEWHNENVDDQGTPVAILIQYGHGTGTGGYVAGRDFINPAMRPLFDEIANDIWKKVSA
jgi:hypothetical protein